MSNVVRYVLLLSVVWYGQGKVFEQRNLTVNQDWSFLDKFCFINAGGLLIIEVEPAHDKFLNQYINMYWDGEEHWPKVWVGDVVCVFVCVCVV